MSIIVAIWNLTDCSQTFCLVAALLNCIWCTGTDEYAPFNDTRAEADTLGVF